jgi:hypothetical protein
MRILLDECVPRRFGRQLPEYEVHTVRRTRDYHISIFYSEADGRGDDRGAEIRERRAILAGGRAGGKFRDSAARLDPAGDA